MNGTSSHSLPSVLDWLHGHHNFHSTHKQRQATKNVQNSIDQLSAFLVNRAFCIRKSMLLFSFHKFKSGQNVKVKCLGCDNSPRHRKANKAPFRVAQYQQNNCRYWTGTLCPWSSRQGSSSANRLEKAHRRCIRSQDHSITPSLRHLLPVWLHYSWGSAGMQQHLLLKSVGSEFGTEKKAWFES